MRGVPLAVVWLSVMPTAVRGEWWSGFGFQLGLNDATFAMETFQGKLHVGGAFTAAGQGQVLSHVGRLDGAAWQGLNSGLNAGVASLLAEGDSVLYVGGWFTQTVGGLPLSHIAAWTGTSWAPLGSGLDGAARALATWEGRLAVGGDFAAAGGQPASHLATWDGVAWQELGDGVSGGDAPVRALLEWDGRLWVGGTFTEAGGGPATYLSSWDGSTWVHHALVPSDHYWCSYVPPVRTIAPFDGGLVVGGRIAAIDGVPIHGLAFYDGSSWTNLGADLPPEAAIAGAVAVGPSLFVIGDLLGGELNTAARWDGASWLPLDGGLRIGFTYWDDCFWGDVEPFLGDVYFGGPIWQAGSAGWSLGIARWMDPATGVGSTAAPAMSSVQLFPNPTRRGTEVAVSLAGSSIVSARIVSVDGSAVRQLPALPLPAGSHTLLWDGLDDAGAPVAPGMYFVLVRIDGEEMSRKCVVLR